MTVTLSWSECQQAAFVGVNRKLRRLRSGSTHRWGWAPEDHWTAELEGAAAELCVAKVLGRYWADESAPDYAGDVGEGLQVRWTHRDNGHLLLHPEDADAHLFALVVGVMPSFRVAGAIDGARGKDERYWRTDTGRPAFFVPQSALEPLSLEAAA